MRRFFSLNGSHYSIRIFYLQKSLHPFTWRIFMPDFQVFQVWRLWFQSIHRHRGVFTVYLLIFGWFSGVKAYSFRPSQAFTTRVNALLPLWTLWNQNLHTRNCCKSAGNKHCVNGWILFSGNKIRIYTRVKRAFTKQTWAFSAWLFRYICPAARGMKFPSQVADYFAQVLE